MFAIFEGELIAGNPPRLLGLSLKNKLSTQPDFDVTLNVGMNPILSRRTNQQFASPLGLKGTIGQALIRRGLFEDKRDIGFPPSDRSPSRRVLGDQAGT